jgi:hypothetical protein
MCSCKTHSKSLSRKYWCNRGKWKYLKRNNERIFFVFFKIAIDVLKNWQQSSGRKLQTKSEKEKSKEKANKKAKCWHSSNMSVSNLTWRWSINSLLQNTTLYFGETSLNLAFLQSLFRFIVVAEDSPPDSIGGPKVKVGWHSLSWVSEVSGKDVHLLNGASECVHDVIRGAGVMWLLFSLRSFLFLYFIFLFGNLFSGWCCSTCES